MELELPESVKQLVVGDFKPNEDPTPRFFRFMKGYVPQIPMIHSITKRASVQVLAPSVSDKPIDFNPFFPLEIQFRAKLFNVLDCSKLMIKLVVLINSNNNYNNNNNNNSSSSSSSSSNNSNASSTISISGQNPVNKINQQQQQANQNQSQTNNEKQQQQQQHSHQHHHISQQSFIQLEPTNFIPSRGSGNCVELNAKISPRISWFQNLGVGDSIELRIDIVNVFELEIPDFDSQFLSRNSSKIGSWRSPQNNQLMGIISISQTPHKLFYSPSLKRQ